jgi:raw score 10.62
VQSVVEHLTQGKTSPLSLCLTEAIEVAEAAKQSMVTEKQISVKK